MRVQRIAFAAALAAAALAGPGEARSLRFQDVFSAHGEPASLHYRVAFRSGGAVHRMDVWRDGDRRLRRDTDRAITSFVFHPPGDAGYKLSILDRQKRIHTSIDRTNLYRIGAFTDWFDLAHGLRHPRGDYVLAKSAPSRPVPAAIQPCTWYDLTEGTRTTRICWDMADRIPLLIAAADGQPLWRVEAIDRKPIPGSRFVIDDKGYIRTDADEDIASD